MVEFFKKMMDWALSKEEELAKNCKIDPKEVDNQIEKVTKKKIELQEKCEEEIAQINKLIERLEKIKAEASSCDTNNNESKDE